jgi:nucleotide-binding universal stress UspA family protein
MKTILVPTDFSKNAENAMNYAIEFAKKEQAKLILLHVFQIDFSRAYVPFDIISEERAALTKEAESKLKDLSKKIKEKSGLICDLLIAEDFIVDAILESVKAKKADFVIMGTKGATGLSGTLFGSNTAKVIKRAKCPVIAVPLGSSFKPLKKIAYATDYHHSDISVLKKIVELVRAFNTQVTILHISDPIMSSETERESMKAFKADILREITYSNIFFQLLKADDIERALEEFVANSETDMIIMCMHHHDLFSKLFGKNISKQMAYHTKIPLMIFHHAGRTEAVVI